MKLVAKILATLFLVAIFLSVLGSGTAKMGERSGVFHRYRDTPVAPRVHVVAVAHRLPNRDVPPICAVHREHWGSCGKSSCWRYVRGITTVTGNLEVKTATSSLPASLDMDSAWVMEPEPDYSEVTSAARKAEWQARGKKAGIDFDSLGADRLVERCIEEGETIYAVGCVEENKLTSCPFDDSWSFVPGDSPRPAILVATNDLAAKLAAAMAALFLVPLIWVPKRGALVEALAQRSGRPLKALKWSYALLLVLPIGLFFNFILKAKFGGFVFFAFVLVGWILIAANLLLRRRRVAQALAPVLATERSPLATATGTAELVVRAKMTGAGHAPVLGPDPVAYVSTVVTDVYQSGRNVRTGVLATIVPSTKLEVADESGEGVLDLSNAILDIDARSIKMKGEPPRLAERGFKLSPSASHIHYAIEERVIRDGDSLYVFGDVTNIELRADGSGGYRSVQGSPTLGGEGHPPLLVFRGDERGLVESLRREGRADYAIAVAASCFAGLAGGIAVFLLMQ